MLALDEIQKIPDWSEAVKRLWDEDTRRKTLLRVVLLGSALLLIARGMRIPGLSLRATPTSPMYWTTGRALASWRGGLSAG